MLVQKDASRTEREGTSHHPQPAAGAIEPPEDRGYAVFKGMLDFGLACLLLLLSLPVILAAALLVKLTSRGPAFYTQKRLGRKGHPFTIYKLRTMVHECERLSGPQWCRSRDPRVLPIGRFLRSSHIDELPQLWNVLRGDMSLIGPRPERPEIIRSLELAIPYYRDRLLVRPGITGLAQVQLPPDSDLHSVRRKLAYDLHYIQQLSLWLDLRLVLCTVFHMAGLPFAQGRRLLRVPGGPALEAAFEDLIEGKRSHSETKPSLLPQPADS
jgi:lipopolysaccharide/colanic/teichoic acid biosynthesis glycosyltransferase